MMALHHFDRGYGRRAAESVNIDGMDRAPRNCNVEIYKLLDDGHVPENVRAIASYRSEDIDIAWNG
jgi:hypothetical protein